MNFLRKSKLEIVSTSLFQHPTFTVTVAIIKRTDKVTNNHTTVWFNGSLTPEAIIESVVDKWPCTKQMLNPYGGYNSYIMFTTSSKAHKRFWAMSNAISNHKINFKTA